MTENKLSAAFAAGPDPHRGREEQAAVSAAASWQPDPLLEGARRLLASNDPEDHRRAETVLSGPRRIALADYEAGLRAHLAAGNQLPAEVLAP
ncbi:hypothetical protein [Actinomycetospora flava]|uniref:Uncharacterized protein n=1 Tax=Actinomycetospora flava TaxID=3129232 RepID=A0ABU8MG78_9PSEU